MAISAAPRPASLAPRMPAALLRLAGDERLVAEVRTGSEVAFEVLYDRHHRGILGFCRHMLGSLEEAEDAVQHTFMAAYRDLVASDKPIQLKAWLYTIARNRCLTVLRARREQPSDEIELVSTDGLAAEVQRREDLRDLLRDVGALPDDQRAALVLAEVGDLAHDDIAAILDCPTAKVKALVFQARSSLAASRRARDTPCEEIRLQLANLRGGSLRRTTLRRHLRECPGCREFRAEMAGQRRALAIVLPVLPALGLKEAVLTAAFGGGAAGAGGAAVAGGGAAAAGGSALVAKGLAVLALAGGGAAGVASMTGDRPQASPARPPALERDSGLSGAPRGPFGPPAAPAAAPASAGEEPEVERKPARSASKPARSGTRSRVASERSRGGMPKSFGMPTAPEERSSAGGRDDDDRGRGAEPGGERDDTAAPKVKKPKKPKKRTTGGPKKPKPPAAQTPPTGNGKKDKADKVDDQPKKPVPTPEATSPTGADDQHGNRQHRGGGGDDDDDGDDDGGGDGRNAG